MIELRDVHKVYSNGTNALKGIDINIDQGEFLFIVGPSGAGKSTFTKLLLREETPSSGSVMVNGYNLVKMRRSKIPYLRRTIGVVFQDFRLIDNKTIYENVAFAMRVIGASPKNIRKRVPYVLGLVGLASKAKSFPREISGGEQQRVALARALVNNPAIIIADEPTGNVDPQMSREIMDLLCEINKRGTTVLVVTHDHDIVQEYDKRVITIKDGVIVSDKEGGK
ncbi:MAG: cell division ATP-binding protein FtsE [Clostridia bacterium]|nr:cell division ATP-binding protein FtsE [Clostridia bacterium]